MTLCIHLHGTVTVYTAADLYMYTSRQFSYLYSSDGEYKFIICIVLYSQSCRCDVMNSQSDVNGAIWAWESLVLVSSTLGFGPSTSSFVQMGLQHVNSWWALSNINIVNIKGVHIVDRSLEERQKKNSLEYSIVYILMACSILITSCWSRYTSIMSVLPSNGVAKFTCLLSYR